MDDEIQEISREALTELANAHSLETIEELRVKYLGRKSRINQLFSQLGKLSPQERGILGKNLNELKKTITAALAERAAQFSQGEDKIDVTYPGKKICHGSKHILSSVTERICEIFENIGFRIAEGDEIEDEWHNFTALNIPLDHPSRDAFDTFYLDIPAQKNGRFLLRSHTSPSQIRVMQHYEVPLAIISPGRVYRPDEVDASHSFMFHQIEGFAVDKNISFSHLKGVLLHFAQTFFSQDIELRFRPHFFPFTEPSAEVDVSCIICKGKKKKGTGISSAKKKCSVCKGKGWLEILGCGMIHPHVLNYCGIDAKKYSGFAFGMGVDRIAMLRYGIDDIRIFYENDIRFLRQFVL